ncbi:TPA: ParD-like family protein [Klebsiella pneumoniae]|nr:ParD-like family protein [Klebsiella pneumoniae]
MTPTCKRHAIHIRNVTECKCLGIAKISDMLHEDVRDASKAMSRSVNAQAEYWIGIGMLSELYPELYYQQIKMMMLKPGSDRLMEVINATNSD